MFSLFIESVSFIVLLEILPTVKQPQQNKRPYNRRQTLSATNNKESILHTSCHKDLFNRKE